jgi:hypothetical protein
MQDSKSLANTTERDEYERKEEEKKERETGNSYDSQSR